MKEFFTKNKTAIIITTIVIIIIVAAYLYYKFSKAPVIDAGKNTGGNNIPPVSSGPPQKTKDDNFPLKQGSYGPNVKYLQTAMNRLNPSKSITADGDFGAKTYQALLLIVGTTIIVDGIQVQSYPVTERVFNEILKEANAKTNSAPPPPPPLTLTAMPTSF